MSPKDRLNRTMLFAAAIALAATTSPIALAATTKDVLVIGKSADPQTLDPAVTMDNNDWTITYPAYQRLVRYKTENGKGSTSVEGELATGWTVSPDNLTWDFKLKPGNSFADGTRDNNMDMVKLMQATTPAQRETIARYLSSL